MHHFFFFTFHGRLGYWRRKKETYRRVWRLKKHHLAARKAYVLKRNALRLFLYSSLCVCVCVCVCMLFSQSCPILCSPMDCSPPGSSVHWILQTILEWVAIPFSRGSSQPRDRTSVSWIAGRFFTNWATREALWIFLCTAAKTVKKK